MKRRGITPSSLLACLLLSVAALLASEPWAKARTSPYRFEVGAESDHSGLAQLYFDTGEGLNEPESALQPVEAGRPQVLRFALPYGRIRALRFDPLDREARMTISGARIVDGSGRTVISFAPVQFEARHEIKSLEVRDGALRIETEPAATLPMLWVNLAGPLTIPRPPIWRGIGMIFAGLVACLFLLGWAWGSDRIRLARRARSLWAAACGSPGMAVAAAALLGTLAANYPVVFAGRSLVSPNLGIALLYGQAPWQPGNAGVDEGGAHGADVDALMWQHVPLSMIERRAVLRERRAALPRGAALRRTAQISR